MDRLLVVVDPEVGVPASAFAAGWGADPRASEIGPAVVEPSSGEVFLPGLVELVVVPVAVNLATSVLYDLVKRIVTAARKSGSGAPGEVEALEVQDLARANGDRLVVVRWRRERS
ncbi:hypothetical protein [Catellatospora chokoriensis]|uniref:hypothetical protein n=1 Tax=Catellatospora chokoriensis TaxID=310353 RepID=UPI00177DA9ED|nr:hypothetical protein [Catellatospora chokoriensis]